MDRPNLKIRRKVIAVIIVMEMALLFLAGRVFYIQAFEADFYQAKAYEQHTRDRLITTNRGSIYDRNMNSLATTETVASVSVIRAQIQDPEYVAKVLSEKLELEYDDVLAKASKRVALERVKTKVDKELADEIRGMNIPGIVVDEDIKRVYPYSTLAPQVIGFVGRDNQGIIGLEAKYDEKLKGELGKILTSTDARGVELKNGEIVREAPIPGLNLVTTIDAVLQEYAEQTIKKAVEAKNAKMGLIILMNPQNGEIYAMANEPGFDLNEPFTINSEELEGIWDTLTSDERMKHLNLMWRNSSINDTYEPGSTFKIITSAAGLEEGVVTPATTFECNSGRDVGGRFIKCWRSPRSHGTVTFIEGLENSCNPVFMDTAEMLGAEMFYEYMDTFGFSEKTGIDLPGEATGIMHKLENVGPVELATMSFGQSFQITPLQLLRAISSTVNGGYLVTPHFGKRFMDNEGTIVEELVYEKGKQVISEETSEIIKYALESVVEVGTGNKTYIPGYRIGGKTATSEKLPRRTGKYIASFATIAPAEYPELVALVLIDEPQGTYYGGQVAGPVMKELLETALPYLGIEAEYSEAELKIDGVEKVIIPDLYGLTKKEGIEVLEDYKLALEFMGDGDIIIGQFPKPNESVNQNSKLLLYLGNNNNDEMEDNNGTRE